MLSRWKVSEVVNAVGYATRIGGSSPAREVLSAMDTASQVYMEIDDLQQVASGIIARETGAEAGIVTCGAAAGLALAAAACMARYDTEIMEQLPDTANVPRDEMLFSRESRFDYDHGIRLSGAKMICVEAPAEKLLKAMEDSISGKTGAIVYAWRRMHQLPGVGEMAELAHKHDIPLIVDGAFSLPPVTNLQELIKQGADLVTYSGGKHLGGPQASGILCGKEDLIMSAWLQMVDMDVRPETWSLKHLIRDGKVPAPPRHGIGRTMKVGKEAITGLLTALERYGARDHQAELKQWKSRVDRIHSALKELPDLRLEKKFPSPNGQPYPVIIVQVSGNSGFTLPALLNKLKQSAPKIILAEGENDFRQAIIYPMCLFEDQIQVLIQKFRWAVGELNLSETG